MYYFWCVTRATSSLFGKVTEYRRPLRGNYTALIGGEVWRGVVRIFQHPRVRSELDSFRVRAPPMIFACGRVPFRKRIYNYRVAESS